MAKIELPISTDYVKSWGVNEALRELFQNMLDREQTVINAQSSWQYDDELKTLILSNKNTKLDKKSLLLGISTKQDSKTTIGQFGEGYKLAMLVLLREGYYIFIENDDELWIPTIEYSEMFETKVLKVEIKPAQHSGSGNLSWNINIESELWEEYHQYNLHLLDSYEKFETSRGELLLGEEQRGRVYVSGLFVTDLSDYKFQYGYNFKPAVLKLGRDRDAVSAFDVQCRARDILTEFSRHDSAPIISMIRESKADIEYMHTMTRNVKDDIAAQFIEAHPGKAIPVSDEAERQEAEQQYPEAAVVFVSSKERECILESSKYQEYQEDWEPPIEIPTPHGEVQQFVNEFKTMFENKTEFTQKFQENIFEKSKNWMWKE